MDQEEKDLLNKTYELSKENSHILKGIRSSNRWSSFVRVLYWIIIIGASVVAYYYIQPYIDTAIKAYQSIQKDLNSVKSIIPGSK